MPQRDLKRPKSRQRARMSTTRSAMQNGITAASLLYAAGLVVLTILNIVGPDHTWIGSLNLYMPQWIWLLPGFPLLAITFVFARHRLWIPLVCLLWAAGPIMGFCWRLPAGERHEPGVHLRIMTYNVKDGNRDADAIISDVQKFHPDVVQMQDSGSVLKGSIRSALADWSYSPSGQYHIFTRQPIIVKSESCNISFPHSSPHHCVRTTLKIGGKQVILYNVHLLSPRYGLVNVRHLHVSPIRQNTADRLYEAGRLAESLREERDPFLLTGDLNAPVQSEVCRQLFDVGLRDAFSEAGQGYGYTYGQYTRLRFPYVRIDHIMFTAPWQVQACWTGNNSGSDHSPVIADLFLPANR